MKLFEMTSATKSADWLIFSVMVLTIGVAVGIVTIWAVLFRPKTGKKHRHKHRRKRHSRQHNPTLAQTGGLPPPRDPNQPPPGP